MKPICFLDVDGVINVFNGDQDWNNHLFNKNLIFPHPLRQGCWTQRDVVLDRRHPALLALLAADFEMVWATAWEQVANVALSDLLGLSQLPVVDFGGTVIAGLHWKTKRLAEWAEDRPFVWIDDQVDARDASWLHTVNSQTMVLRCDPVYGLGEKQVLAALDFAAPLAGSKT